MKRSDSIDVRVAQGCRTSAALALAGVLLSGCVTVGLAPDRSSEKGPAAYVRGSVERLNDPQLRVDDPQELAMRLHFLAVLAREEPKAWTPEDRTATVRASVPLLTYAWAPPSGNSPFSRKPVLLGNDAGETVVRIRQLAMDLATALPSPEFAQALAGGSQALVSTDCPRYLLAVKANAGGLESASHRLTLAQGLLLQRARLQASARSGVTPQDAALLRCVAAVEAQVLREQDHAALWAAEPESRSALYVDSLRSSTEGALARALAQPQPSRQGVQALEAALRARAQLPQASALLQTYFPWSYLQAAALPAPAAPEADAALSRHLAAHATVARVLARLPATEGSAAPVPWVDWPDGGRMFNPRWVSTGEASDLAPGVAESFWLRYETTPAQDEEAWLLNLYRGGRWEAVRRHMSVRPVTSPVRWLASWAAALNTSDGPLLIKASLATASAPDPATRIQGLWLLSGRAVNADTLRGACPAALLRGLGDALQASNLADDRAALLQALGHCLGRNPYDPAHKPALAGLSKLDGSDGSFRAFVNARPLTWLLDASQDALFPLGLLEPALRIRSDEFMALTPAERQRVMQVLASLVASAHPAQSLPARRLYGVFRLSLPASEMSVPAAR